MNVLAKDDGLPVDEAELFIRDVNIAVAIIMRYTGKTRKQVFTELMRKKRSREVENILEFLRDHPDKFLQ